MILRVLSIKLILLLLLTGCSLVINEKDHLRYGNPSQANTEDKNNYLMNKPQYALSYNCRKGIANWVSWQLDSSWLGDTKRANDFRPDQDLPTDCEPVLPSDYRGSGYDRGHLTPSGDRTNNPEDNSATFLMTNMIPQSPANNREVWRELEEYSRDLVDQGKELYIVAGSDGQRKKLKRKITVPVFTWKVILVLSNSGKIEDAIAVRIPNAERVANKDWRDYLVSIDEIEKKTGYNFFSLVEIAQQKKLEAKLYR